MSSCFTLITPMKRMDTRQREVLQVKLIINCFTLNHVFYLGIFVSTPWFIGPFPQLFTFLLRGTLFCVLHLFILLSLYLQRSFLLYTQSKNISFLFKTQYKPFLVLFFSIYTLFILYLFIIYHYTFLLVCAFCFLTVLPTTFRKCSVNVTTQLQLIQYRASPYTTLHSFFIFLLIPFVCFHCLSQFHV